MTTKEYNETNRELLKDYLINGNEEAYDKLIVNNLSCIALTLKNRFHFPDLDEAISKYYAIGVIGLIKSIKTYNIENINKITFATYATVCIRNEILMEMRKEKKRFKTISMEEKMDFDEKVTMEELIGEIDLGIEEIVENEYKKYKYKCLYRAFDKLTYQEKECLSRYYGLFDRYCENQHSISIEANISQSYVSRVIKRALAKLEKELQQFKDDYR